MWQQQLFPNRVRILDLIGLLWNIITSGTSVIEPPWFPMVGLTRTSLYLGFRDIFPVESRPLTAGFTYIFSPKYAISAFSSYDFGTNMSLANSVVFSRTGTDVQVNLGFTYNAMQNNFGFVFEILPRVVANAVRGGLGVSPGLLSGY